MLHSLATAFFLTSTFKGIFTGDAAHYKLTNGENTIVSVRKIFLLWAMLCHENPFILSDTYQKCALSAIFLETNHWYGKDIGKETSEVLEFFENFKTPWAFKG